MILKQDTGYILHTKNTTYAIDVMETGHLEHLYYGKKIHIHNLEALREKYAFPPGNGITYDDKNYPKLALEDVRLEMSGMGHGDIREPFVELIFADGNTSTDFLFEKAEISQGKEDFETLPGSYDEEDKVEHLCITLIDRNYPVKMELHYYVYEAADVITRSTRLINYGSDSVQIRRLMSAQVDFDEAGYMFHYFTGAWAREMKKQTVKVEAGMHVVSSFTGNSSNRANPFVMVSKEHTTENAGDCYGFNLIYSSNHFEALQVSAYNKTRFLSGINPRNFSYLLEEGESFEAPEAVMSFSHKGFNALSQNLHYFVRNHIVRGQWKYKERPVLLNSWEACYFKINETKLVNLAKAGKEVGVELFVLDDGWFGNRDDDTKGLGDWDVNKKKFPKGIKGLSEKIKALGLDFGIWVEPEMVNTDSDLYRTHPDWAIEAPVGLHSEGRHQRILDLTRIEVQDFLIEKMSEVFSSGEISYVKWDMNRDFTDYYSKALQPQRQQEVAHRYILGLYRVMKELVKRFPHILFEGCASGGDRFDLGILCYFPQIWASDDTDAVCRAKMQTGYSYGYPMSTVGAHVSAVPNHQTLRTTPLSSRFHVAAFGVLGYECNLKDMKKEEQNIIKEQIELYKKWRKVLQFGNFYRGENCNENGIEWTCVSPDKSKAVSMMMHFLVEPNTRYACLKPQGLMEDKLYRFYNLEEKRRIKEFGSLVNMISPVYVKQDSLVHNVIDKMVKLPGDVEDEVASGDALMDCGIKLKQAFAGTGLDENVRVYKDFETRLYFMEE